MSVRQHRHGSNVSWVAVPHSRTLLVRWQKDWRQGRGVILKVCLILWGKMSVAVLALLLALQFNRNLTDISISDAKNSSRVPYNGICAWRVDSLDLKPKPEHV